MKKLFTRLLGASDENADRQAGVNAAQHAAPGAAADARADRFAEVSLAFFHWMAGAVPANAAGAAPDAILERLARLAHSPEDAADLVPRMPEVIPQLLRSLRDDDVAGAELARQVAQDVVLVAAVIREANSAYYRQTTPVRSLEGAIMLIGQNGLRMVIARVALKPIIGAQTGRIARLVAQRIWSQSDKCAMAASLLAPNLHANQFEAYLAGLMQNVGLMVAFQVIDRVCEEGGMPRSDEFVAALLASARALSGGIARYWELPESVADAIARAGQPGATPLARVLAQGDMLARLRLMVDAGALAADDPFVLDGLDAFQLRCFDKLRREDD